MNRCDMTDRRLRPMSPSRSRALPCSYYVRTQTVGCLCCPNDVESLDASGSHQALCRPLTKVREQCMELLMYLVDDVTTPQSVWDHVAGGLAHRVPRVRQQCLVFFEKVITKHTQKAIQVDSARLCLFYFPFVVFLADLFASSLQPPRIFC
jgi:hypothetical protein